MSGPSQLIVAVGRFKEHRAVKLPLLAFRRGPPATEHGELLVGLLGGRLGLGLVAALRAHAADVEGEALRALLAGRRRGRGLDQAVG